MFLAHCFVARNILHLLLYVYIFAKSVTYAVVVYIPVEFRHIKIVCVNLTFSGFTCIYHKPGFTEADVVYIDKCIG